MKKNKFMTEVEERIGEPLEVFLNREYIENEKTIKEIAEELDMGRDTTRKLLIKNNIKLRTASKTMFILRKRNSGKTKKMLEIEEKVGEPITNFLQREYIEKVRSPYEIAEGWDVSVPMVRKFLEYYNFKIRNASEARLKGKEKPSKEWLYNEYIIKGRSTIDIAEELGVENCSVGRWMKEDNIKARNASEALLNGKKKPSDEWLREQYVVKERNTADIGREVGVSGSAIVNWLKNINIYVKSRNERINELCIDKDYRRDIIDGFLEELKKRPEELTITDFSKRGTNKDVVVSPHSVLNWYTRQRNCKGAEARDILIQDLYGVSRNNGFERLEAVVDGFLEDS